MDAQTFTDAQRNSFAEAERMAQRFSLADRVLISSPMWNFGIPYKLKQWFDIMIQPGLTFRFDPARGYLPLLKDRPTIIILACGSDFATGMNRGRIDMATPYLREALRFIGVRDVRFVPIGPTTGPPSRSVRPAKTHIGASPRWPHDSDPQACRKGSICCNTAPTRCAEGDPR